MKIFNIQYKESGTHPVEKKRRAFLYDLMRLLDFPGPQGTSGNGMFLTPSSSAKKKYKEILLN